VLVGAFVCVELGVGLFVGELVLVGIPVFVGLSVEVGIAASVCFCAVSQTLVIARSVDALFPAGVKLKTIVEIQQQKKNSKTVTQRIINIQMIFLFFIFELLSVNALLIA